MLSSSPTTVLPDYRSKDYQLTNEHHAIIITNNCTARLLVQRLSINQWTSCYHHHQQLYCQTIGPKTINWPMNIVLSSSPTTVLPDYWSKDYQLTNEHHAIIITNNCTARLLVQRLSINQWTSCYHHHQQLYCQTIGPKTIN